MTTHPPADNALRAEIERAKSLIRSIEDYPEPGVTYRDITPLLIDPRAFTACIEALIEPVAGQFDVVAGIEARGFFLAGAVAQAAHVGIVPLRKAGKLPRPAAHVDYNLEYGSDSLEVSEDLKPGMKVFLVDDILATGGSLSAGRQLIEQRGADVVASAVMLELDGLGGAERVPDCRALFTF